MWVYALLSFVVLSSAHDRTWQPQGPADPDHVVSYSIMLPQNNLDLLYRAVQDVSDPDSSHYGEYWTRERIEDLVCPSKQIVSKVQQYLDRQGVRMKTVWRGPRYEMKTVVSDEPSQTNCSHHGDFFRCHSTVRDVERMFSVKMWYYLSLKNVGVYAVRSLEDYVVPEEIRDSVVFVSGISDHLFQARHTPRTHVKDVSVDSRFVARESMLHMYNVSAEQLANSTITLVEFQGGGFGQNDLDNSSVANGVTPLTVVQTVGPNPGGGIETELDVTMALDLLSAPHVNSSLTNVTVRSSNYPNWLNDMTADILTRKNVSEVLSLSYGWAEDDQCDIVQCNGTSGQYVDRINNDLAKIALLGITVVVASGDAGAPGRTNEGCDPSNPINPVFPGSSPYVLSVGATATLSDNSTQKWKTPICKTQGCTTGTKTVPVNFNNVGWTSGSGFGIYSTEDRSKHAPHQNDAVKEYLSSGVQLPNASSWNSAGRGYPDVTANGHNCPVFDIYGGGQFSAVDGTSCSCPVWASLVSRINDHQKSKGRPVVGLVAPLLYKLANSCPKAFTPVTDSGNSHCTEDTCCSGDYGFSTPPKPTTWNPVTGLGQPNLGQLLNCLDSVFEKRW